MNHLAPPASRSLALTGTSIVTRRTTVLQESAFTRLVGLSRGTRMTRRAGVANVEVGRRGSQR